MIPLKNNPNVDNSDPVNYPDGRVKDNTGTGNGTPVNRNVYGDLHSNISKLMRLYDIVPNQFPDNETNGFQIIEALKALASKNDYIYPLNTSSGSLSVDLKLNLLKENEFFVCLAAVNKTTETTIKGSDGSEFVITYSGNFKANEYVRLIKTASGISIIRIADWTSLEAMVSELNFLKKATQAQENAGTSDLVSTTPLVNKVAFQRRVNGDDSAPYLASASQNGLMSIAQFNLLAGLVNNVKNLGWFAGFNVGGSSGALPVDGDILSATASIGDSGKVLVTLKNAMSGTNYFVRMHVQGESANVYTDVDICTPVFKILSSTQFEVGFREITTDNQNLKVHLEVVQL